MILLLRTNNTIYSVHFLFPCVTYLALLHSYFYRVGFSDVKAMDQTAYFIEILESELKNFKPQKEAFVKVIILHVVILHKCLGRIIQS